MAAAEHDRSIIPDRRYQRGRRIMLISAAVFALSRALYYLPSQAHAIDIPPAVQLLSYPFGIWIWVALWVSVVVLCVRDMFRKSGRLGISMLVGACLLWGAAYAFSYTATVIQVGFGSREWYNFCTYVCLSGVIYGLLTKVGALKYLGEK